MLQFVSLLNHLNTTGSETFAKFLNTATSSEASRAGQWFGSAATAEVKKAAELLNAGQLDEFRDHIGIRPSLWSRLFGSKKPAAPSVSMPAMPEPPVVTDKTIKTTCPHCEHRVRYAAKNFGRKTKCPECGETFRLPTDANSRSTSLTSSAPAARAAAPAKPATSSDWNDLTAYLKSSGSAEFDIITDLKVYPNIIRYYEFVVADPTSPKLRYYVLSSAKPEASHPYLILATGEQSEFDKAWHFNYKPILELALPGQGWSAVSRDGYANHSKPGCQLASTAPFLRIADSVLRGDYKFERVFYHGQATTPAAPAATDEMESLLSLVGRKDILGPATHLTKLVELGPRVVPRLLPLLDSSDVNVVADAADVLSRLKAVEAIPKLQELRNSSWAEVQQAARAALASLQKKPTGALKLQRTNAYEQITNLWTAIIQSRKDLHSADDLHAFCLESIDAMPTLNFPSDEKRANAWSMLGSLICHALDPTGSRDPKPCSEAAECYAQAIRCDPTPDGKAWWESRRAKFL